MALNCLTNPKNNGYNRINSDWGFRWLFLGSGKDKYVPWPDPGPVEKNGVLFAEMRELYEAFPDRFMIGMDVAHAPGMTPRTTASGPSAFVSFCLNSRRKPRAMNPESFNGHWILISLSKQERCHG